MSRPSLLPRAKLRDVLAGDAPLIGARADSQAPRGLISPVEARHRLGLAYGDPRIEERSRLADRTFFTDVSTVVRTALAQPFPAPIKGGRPRPFIVSSRVDALTVAAAVDAIAASHDLPRARLVWFVHPHALNLAVIDRAHAERLERADLVLPDGVGTRIAAAVVGTPLRHNINGTDLLPLLCAALATSGRPLSLVGGAKGVARAAADRLVREHPGLRLGVVEHGFLDDARAAELRDELRNGEPSVVLVGMGSPRQEEFALRWLGDLPGSTVVTVGGLFDFFSGRAERAPVVCRELGLEWAYRMLREPRRLGPRYILGNPVFLALAVLQRWGVCVVPAKR